MYCKLNKKVRSLNLEEGILDQITSLLAKTSFEDKGTLAEVKLENKLALQQDECSSNSTFPKEE